MSDEIFITTHDDPRAAPLVDELSREYDERYGLNDGIPSSFELRRYPAADFTPANGGIFLLVVRDGETIAGGAFKRVDARTAEIKRVWTSSAHRRQGLARLVMASLEAHAAAGGYDRVELTTGARQPEALALYVGLGYTPRFSLDDDFEELGYLAFDKDLQISSSSGSGEGVVAA